MWWEPDFMHDKWRYTDLKYRLTKVAMPPPNKVCVANRASANDRCSTNVTTRQGTALGNCDHPNEVLFKVFSKQLESNTYAFEFLRNLQLTNSEVGEMLGKWAFDPNLNNGAFANERSTPTKYHYPNLIYRHSTYRPALPPVHLLSICVPPNA